MHMLAGRYQIIRQLSQGGFGVTHLAKDTMRPGMPHCVVKELHHHHQNNPKIVELFQKEAEMLERLGEHDQIPRLLASFEQTNRFYLVQEYIHGVTLEDELEGPSRKKQRKTEAEVVALLHDALTTLAFVHQQNVVHRDIKPANLMRRKRDGKIMLIDFGAVKALTHSQISAKGRITTTVSIGTPGYSPLEQMAQGNPRLASDIYALGVTAIEALTGVYPSDLVTDPMTAELVWRDRCRISQGLAMFLEQMVRHHFSRRFQDAGAALTALESVAGGGVSTHTSSSRKNLAWQKQQSKPPKTAVVKPQVRPQAAAMVKPRRDVLRFAGFSVAGVMLTLGGQRLLQGMGNGESLPSSDVSPEEVESTPTGEPLQTLEFTTVQVNPQGEIISEPAGQVQYFDEPYLLGKLGDALPLRMVEIPAGEFTRGSPADEIDRDDNEGPQRSVTVPRFFMGAFAVTQQQYQEMMGQNPSYFTDNGVNRPVEQVSWLDAEAFCKKLSDLTGRTYRLPSEAEWEYACRAGTTTPFSFGETLTPEIANYNGNFTYGSGPQGDDRQETVAVDRLSLNAFGLYNMHGNIWEWCADDYHESYNGAPDDGNIWLSNREDALKVLRGGSWDYVPRNCRSAYRHWYARANAYYDVGFRVVCLPPA